MLRSRQLSVQGHELQFAVNHLGHYLLVRLLLPLLQRSEHARVIIVSSIAHDRGKIFFDDLSMSGDKVKYSPGTSYGQSKLANVMFARELAKRLQGTGIVPLSLHPGVIRTELVRRGPSLCPPIALDIWRIHSNY